MMRKLGKYCLVIFPLLLCLTAYNQQQESDPTATVLTDTVIRKTDTATLKQTTPFSIGEIYISGNHKTRAYIIERELPFKRGDPVNLPQLVKAFSRAREQLINTHLFNEVVITLKGFRGFITDIQIDVKERWYIFPLPYFKPVDRNLTAWAERNYSLARVDLGLKYSQYNFTGRNDNLRAWLIGGYSRQVEFAYDQPYADKTLKHGFGMGFSYIALKELNVITIDNKQQFLSNDSISYAGKYLREQFSLSFRYYFRPAIKTKHLVRLNFIKTNIDSAVYVYNPHYLNNNKTHLFYPELSYVLNYNNVDYVPYPLKGFLFETGFLQRGFTSDMHLSQVYAKSIKSWQLSEKTYFNTQNLGILKLPFNQPFYNEQFFGYNDFYMRGLEKYVIDGVAGVLTRNTLLHEMFNFNVPFLHSAAHDHIPFRIFAKTYFDCSYVYNKFNPVNSLSNRMLYSAGIGLDVVTFYDLVFRFEYSFNQLGQNGLFLHFRNDF